MSSQQPSLSVFCDRPASQVAPELIGALLMKDGAGGVIVETEAYEREDPASHSFSGPGRRNASMFGPAAQSYVYRSYGIHWCFNVVCATGTAVLIRAVEPLHGLEAMVLRRGMADTRLLCSGPGRLCQALGIEGMHDGLPLDGSAGISLRPPDEALRSIACPRIGISRAIDMPWRFVASGSRFASRRPGVSPRSPS